MNSSPGSVSLVLKFVCLYADSALGPSHRELGLTATPPHPHTLTVLTRIRERQSCSSSSVLFPLVYLFPSSPTPSLLPVPPLQGLRSVREQPSPCAHSALWSEVCHWPPCLPTPGLCLAICPSAVGLPSSGRKGGGVLMCHDPGPTLACWLLHST